MTWVRIDDQMPQNEKVARLSHLAFRVYVGSICFCGQKLTDGRLERAMLTLIPHATAKIAKELVESGLWEMTSEGWFVHDYLTYNRSRADVEAMSVQRREAGRKGLASRYSKPLATSVAARDTYARSAFSDLTNNPTPNCDLAENRETEQQTASDLLEPAVREMRDTIMSKLPQSQQRDALIWDEAESFARDYAGQMRELCEAIDQVRRLVPRRLPFPSTLREFMPAMPEPQGERCYTQEAEPVDWDRKRAADRKAAMAAYEREGEHWDESEWQAKWERRNGRDRIRRLPVGETG